MADIKLEASIIFEPYRPEALRRALEYAAKISKHASTSLRNLDFVL